MSQGKLIVLEGMEGAGKSTLMTGLTRALEAQDRPLLCLREPGSTPLGEQLRELLQHSQLPITPRSETLLFCAARAQLFQQRVQPALQAGQWVLLDRHQLSTLAYQGVLGGQDLDAIEQLSAFATGGMEPDLVLFLDLPAQLAAQRMQARSDQPDRIEQQLDLQLLHQAYQQLLPRQPHLLRLDAEQPAEQVLGAALDGILAL